MADQSKSGASRRPSEVATGSREFLQTPVEAHRQLIQCGRELAGLCGMYVVAALLLVVWLLGVWPFPGAAFLPFVALGLAMFKAMTD